MGLVQLNGQFCQVVPGRVWLQTENGLEELTVDTQGMII
jgi:hypothetical protein